MSRQISTQFVSEIFFAHGEYLPETWQKVYGDMQLCIPASVGLYFKESVDMMKHMAYPPYPILCSMATYMQGSSI